MKALALVLLLAGLILLHGDYSPEVDASSPVRVTTPPTFLEGFVTTDQLVSITAALDGTPTSAQSASYALLKANADDGPKCATMAPQTAGILVAGEYLVDQANATGPKIALRNDMKCAAHSASLVAINKSDLTPAERAAYIAKAKEMTLGPNGVISQLTGMSGFPSEVEQGNLTFAFAGCGALYESLYMLRMAGELSPAEIDQVTAWSDTVVIHEMNQITDRRNNWDSWGTNCKAAAFIWSARTIASVLATFQVETEEIAARGITGDPTFGDGHTSEMARGDHSLHYHGFRHRPTAALMRRIFNATGVNLFNSGNFPLQVAYYLAGIIEPNLWPTVPPSAVQTLNSVSPTLSTGSFAAAMCIRDGDPSVCAYNEGGQDWMNGTDPFMDLFPPLAPMNIPPLPTTLLAGGGGSLWGGDTKSILGR